MNGVLFALLAATAADPAAASPQVGPVRQPSVKVWLDRGTTLDKGDKVRVRVRTDLDGYLLVLHAEPDGRVRVLFPLDPLNDNFIRGAQDFELLGRGDRETFRVYISEGYGTVYAAYSRDPFRVQEFVRGDHWDYLLDVWEVREDAEAELTALAQQMATASFDYDLVRYDVGRVVAGGYGYDSYYESPRYRSGSSFTFALHFGRPYAPFSYRFRRAYYASHCYDWYWYDPYYYDSWYCRPFHSGVYYDPFFPYWYDPFYYPYSRAYYYSYPRSSYHPRTVIAYYPTDTRFIDRRFTLKDDHDRGGSRLLDMRRRTPSDGPTLRRAAVTTTTRRVLADRNAAPTRRTVTDTRRGGTTVRQPDAARRPAADQPSVDRRPDVTRRPDSGPTTVTPRRPASPVERDAEPRRVRPDGWGITDGTRTITPRRPAPVEPQDATRLPDARRPDAPADERRPAPVTRDREPAARQPVRQPDVQRRPNTERRSTSRQLQPVESRRSGSTVDRLRSGTRVEQRSSPQRIEVQRSAPQRVEPARRAPQFNRQPASVQRSPVRMVPSRTPTVRRGGNSRVRTPTRVLAPRQSVRPTRRPAVKRPAVRRPAKKKND